MKKKFAKRKFKKRVNKGPRKGRGSNGVNILVRQPGNLHQPFPSKLTTKISVVAFGYIPRW